MYRDPTTNEQVARAQQGTPVFSEEGLRQRLRNDRQRDVALLGGTIVLLAAGFLVDVNADGAIYLRGCPHVTFPVICPTRRFFGTSCPACGVTRSVVYLLHGRPSDSFTVHRLGWLVLALMVLQIPYRAFCLTGRGHLFNFWAYGPEIVLASFLLLLVVNWLVP
jgi:uncharacterized protein DUF2752